MNKVLELLTLLQDSDKSNLSSDVQDTLGYLLNLGLSNNPKENPSSLSLEEILEVVQELKHEVENLIPSLEGKPHHQLYFDSILTMTELTMDALQEEQEDIFHGFSYYFAHFLNEVESSPVEESLKPYRLIEGYFKEGLTQVYMFCPLTLDAYSGEEEALTLEEISSQLQVEIEKALDKTHITIIISDKENGFYPSKVEDIPTDENGVEYSLEYQEGYEYNFALVRSVQESFGGVEERVYLTCEGNEQFQADSPEELRAMLFQALDWVQNLNNLK